MTRSRRAVRRDVGPMDQDRVDRMLNQILNAVQENFDRGPLESIRILEALAALAFTTATVLEGTDHADEMIDFFYRALADEARRMRSNKS